MSHHPDRLFLAVLIAFALALIALGAVASLVVLAASATLLTGATLLAATFGLTFVLLSLFCVRPDDPCSLAWDALSQATLALKQALQERDEAQGHWLYERAVSAVQFAQSVAPSCVPLHQAMTALAEMPLTERQQTSSEWRTHANRCLGLLLALSPFAIPPVRWAIWTQTLWQVFAIAISGTIAIVTWQGISNPPLRALSYAFSGGILGASLYNLRTLADHIAVQCDYSPRFWVDYLTRPLLGGVLGIVVYAFAAGLAWTLTLQSPVGDQMPKVIFALGFLSGYALRSVLAWLNSIAKSIFRPAPSPSPTPETLPRQNGGE
jgi:hypothetical protein